MDNVKTKLINGYTAIYLPEHPHALAAPKMYGWVYLHRVVAETFLNRPLRDDEEVHHLDENKQNNHPENLLVLTQSQHQKLHGWMRRMGIDPKTYPTRLCICCNSVLSVEQTTYCNPNCQSIGRRKVTRPNKEQLENDMLILSMVKIGKKYSVSDNTVRKWCRGYGIDIPARFVRYGTNSGHGTAVQIQ